MRLTLWYTALMALTLAASSLYQYLRLRQTLLASIDTSLKLAVAQAMTNVDTEDDGLAFQDPEKWSVASNALLRQDFAAQLLAPDGSLWGQVGSTRLPSVPIPPAPGYRTVRLGAGQAWRVYSQPLPGADGEILGWVQAVQSLEAFEDTLDQARARSLAGLLIVALLGSVGGLFLADRALSPIDRMTRTAQSIINTGDLSRRINLQGPEDEVGRLGRIFDQMLSRLQAAFERERRFTADAAHELRTPLTAIKGQLEVCLSRPRRPEEYRITLQRSLEQVDRLIRLSNGLLFLSRADQERIACRFVPVRLADLLQTLQKQLRPWIVRKGLSWQVDISPQLVVQGDPDLLSRLFLNLLDNAVKYTPAEGTVSIQASRKGVDAEILLWNSGPGIPSEHLPRLWERFYRVEDDRASSSGGAGLGLAIASEIVRLHRGQIRLHSRPGSGVTVTVLLPLDRSAGS